MRIRALHTGGVQGAAWVEKLLVGEYDSLTTGERVEALADLLHLSLDLPSVHSSLDRHYDEVERQKRLIREEAKEERKNRQKEMAARMIKDAEDAKARVTALRQKMQAGACCWFYFLFTFLQPGCANFGCFGGGVVSQNFLLLLRNLRRVGYVIL